MVEFLIQQGLYYEAGATAFDWGYQLDDYGRHDAINRVSEANASLFRRGYYDAATDADPTA